MSMNYTDKMTWTREDIHDYLRDHLNAGRYQHTLGVVKAAVELAHLHGADAEKAEYAALCHDMLKEKDRDWLISFITDNGEEAGEGLLAWKTLHAQAGAIFAERQCGQADSDILNAIRFHTTGRVQMSLLEKIIFVADFIEEGRSFRGVDELRQRARTDLDAAVLEALENSLSFLKEKGEHVMPISEAARNHYYSVVAERNHHE